MAQTTDRPDAQQPYQGLALGSIPSSATVRELGDGTKIYDFTDDDGTQVRCAFYDLAGGTSLMSCEKEPQVLSKTEARYRLQEAGSGRWLIEGVSSRSVQRIVLRS